MKQKTRRTGRWTERAQQADSMSSYRATATPPREPRLPAEPRGAGPYEASRDIAMGYAQDRSILLP